MLSFWSSTSTGLSWSLLPSMLRWMSSMARYTRLPVLCMISPCSQACRVRCRRQCIFSPDALGVLCRSLGRQGSHGVSCAQIEGQKATQARSQKERAAMSKLDKLKADQAQRADTLAANAMTAEEQVHSEIL